MSFSLNNCATSTESFSVFFLLLTLLASCMVPVYFSDPLCGTCDFLIYFIQVLFADLFVCC